MDNSKILILLLSIVSIWFFVIRPLNRSAGDGGETAGGGAGRNKDTPTTGGGGETAGGGTGREFTLAGRSYTF